MHKEEMIISSTNGFGIPGYPHVEDWEAWTFFSCRRMELDPHLSPINKNQILNGLKANTEDQKL